MKPPRLSRRDGRKMNTRAVWEEEYPLSGLWLADHGFYTEHKAHTGEMFWYHDVCGSLRLMCAFDRKRDEAGPKFWLSTEACDSEIGEYCPVSPRDEAVLAFLIANFDWIKHAARQDYYTAYA